MVHHITLFKLKPEVTPAKLEQMMMTTRMSLLKIPEILSVKCGKAIDPKSEWPFFIALDFESMEKLAVMEDDAIYMKFAAEILKPHTAERLALNYEMEPGKNGKFS
jgi:Stress responsive A/B Barrel Domain